MSALSLLQLLLPLLAVGRGQRSEPDRPSCDHCDLLLYCNCSHGGFGVVPMVTAAALSLDLSFNSIGSVRDQDLTGHAPLRLLSLHANRISSVGPLAFRWLTNLEQLDLSDNQLSSISHQWFVNMEALQQLNLLNNPHRSLASSPPVFQQLLGLRRLAFGGAALEELSRGDLSGVTQLEELTLHANNLLRYEAGTLASIWPLGGVVLSLRGPFLSNPALAAAVLEDVSYPDTPMVLEDLHIVTNRSTQPFRVTARRRVRKLTLRNVSVSDEAIVHFLEAEDGAPLTSFSIEGGTLTGEGRWEPASWTDHRALESLYVRNVVVLDVYQFASFLQLGFLLQYLNKVSMINSKVFVMPCATSHLLVKLQFLDLSHNLLTDMTLDETLCSGDGTLKELRVLNVSHNALKSLSTVSVLVLKLSKLVELELSGNSFSRMPSVCSWPPTLQTLNISRAKLSTVTSCLPSSLQVLDLSGNDLEVWVLSLPHLKELHLTGNKLLRLPAGRLLPNLHTLSIQSNTLNSFSRSDLRTFRRLRNLEAGHNKWVCSCELVDFLQSAFRGDGGVVLRDGQQSYVCDSPLRLRGAPLVRVRLGPAQCQRQLLVSLSCAAALLLALLLGLLLHRLHFFWYVQMTWAWLRAKRGSRHRRRRRRPGDTEPLLVYDAFVSYSERDAGWVENFLVPELEENRGAGPGGTDGGGSGGGGLSLCLHKRDFLPGHWIVDNILSAMERSRRTIFILSDNFVRSDWCRYELDFSHFRLFDGTAGARAAILVLLEPLSRDDVPKRFYKLRRLMSSTTYLRWPQDEERRPDFWLSLRRALSGDREEEEEEELEEERP